jgi:hypothetical protein
VVSVTDPVFETLCFLVIWITKTPWPESASGLYLPSDHRLSEKLVPTFADRGHVVSVTDPVSETLCFLVIWNPESRTMDTAHKSSGSECHALSSEPFRVHTFALVFKLASTVKFCRFAHACYCLQCNCYELHSPSSRLRNDPAAIAPIVIASRVLQE